MNKSEVIWSHDKRGQLRYLPFSIIIDLFFIVSGVTIAISSGKPSMASAPGIAIGMGFILTGIAHFILKTINYVFAETVKYILTEEAIIFEYGIFKRIRESIPYQDVIKIKKIKEKKQDLSSLIIYSIRQVEYKGFDETYKELRPLPSIDLIPNADEPLHLIHERIAQNDIGQLKRALESGILIDELGLSESSDSRKWNSVLAFVYLLVGFLICLALVDVHLIKPNFVEDVLVNFETTLGESGDQLWVTCQTESGNDFRVFQMQGGLGHKLKLHVSKIFGIIHHIEADSGIRVTMNTSVFYGILNWVFPLFAIYYLAAGMAILRNKSRIKSDDRGILYIGPICTLFLIRVCFYLAVA